MSGSARITDVEAVVNFLAALRQFQDEALTALSMLDQQVARGLQYFDQDLPSQWKQGMRRCYDDVAAARVRLETRRNRTIGGQRSACIEEKQDLEEAKKRLHEAQEKIELVRRWSIHLHKESDEFRGRSGRCKRFLETDLFRMIALLERTIASLEQYLDRPLTELDNVETDTASQSSEGT